jgi:hypothetical protein
VTVCIGAMIRGTYLVNICDSKVSIAGAYSADMVMDKLMHVHPNWTVMVSANDITHFAPISRAIRGKLWYAEGQEPGNVKAEPKTLGEVTQACISSYQQFRQQQIIANFLSSHQLTPERFLSEGKKLLGLSLFTQIWNAIDQLKIECELLVTGFDSTKNVHIFTVNDPGICTSYDSLGFWAIGSGQNQALSSIFYSFKYLPANVPVEALVYDLCAAKFMAEADSNVGESTLAISQKYGLPPFTWPVEGIETMRRAWLEEGRPRRPEGIEIRIKTIMKGMI